MPTSELSGHAAEVAAVVRHPTVAGQLYTASADATLRLWDSTAGTLIRSLEVPGAVESIVIPGGTGAGSTSGYCNVAGQ